MSPRKRLRGFVHDVAHHAVSALSFLHPELRSTQPDADRISIDLLHRDVNVASQVGHDVQAFRLRFAEWLARTRVEASILRSASATFFYRVGNGWPYACHVRLELTDGEVVEDAVGWDGRRVEILRP